MQTSDSGADHAVIIPTSCLFVLPHEIIFGEICQKYAETGSAVALRLVCREFARNIPQAQISDALVYIARYLPTLSDMRLLIFLDNIKDTMLRCNTVGAEPKYEKMRQLYYDTFMVSNHDTCEHLPHLCNNYTVETKKWMLRCSTLRQCLMFSAIDKDCVNCLKVLVDGDCSNIDKQYWPRIIKRESASIIYWSRNYIPVWMVHNKFVTFDFIKFALAAISDTIDTKSPMLNGPTYSLAIQCAVYIVRFGTAKHAVKFCKTLRHLPTFILTLLSCAVTLKNTEIVRVVQSADCLNIADAQNILPDYMKVN